MRAGDELLARAALAGDEHRGVGGCDALHHVEDMGHRLALAEHLAFGRHRGAPEAHELLAEGRVPERALGGQRHLVEIQGLGEKVVRAGAERGDRVLERRVLRGDEEHHPVVALRGLVAQLAGARGREVDEDGAELSAQEARPRLLGGSGARGVELPGAQRGGDAVGQVQVVIDDEDALVHH